MVGVRCYRAACQVPRPALRPPRCDTNVRTRILNILFSLLLSLTALLNPATQRWDITLTRQSRGLWGEGAPCVAVWLLHPSRADPAAATCLDPDAGAAVADAPLRASVGACNPGPPRAAPQDQCRKEAPASTATHNKQHLLRASAARPPSSRPPEHLDGQQEEEDGRALERQRQQGTRGTFAPAGRVSAPRARRRPCSAVLRAAAG